MRIGLLGLGNVGAAFYRLVRDQADEIEARTGMRLEVGLVAVRSLSKARPVEVDPARLTTDANSVVADPGIDLVVEVLGGIEPARELTMAALKAGKPVVTANKELLANVGAELFQTADAAGVDLLFEASVAGGIPLMRPLRESLRGEPVTRVMGIVNGTTNYILTKMTEEGTDYGVALAEAQSLGYAERDPTADVEGYDAGAKSGHHRHRGVRLGRRGRRRLPRRHRRDHHHRHRFRHQARLCHQAARRDRASGPRRRRRDRRSGAPRAGAGGSPARLGTRELQRRLRRG